VESKTRFGFKGAMGDLFVSEPNTNTVSDDGCRARLGGVEERNDKQSNVPGWSSTGHPKRMAWGVISPRRGRTRGILLGNMVSGA